MQSMGPQAIRSHSSRKPKTEKGRQGSDVMQRSHDTSGALPVLLNRSQNMADRKEHRIESSVDEAHVILSKHTALGYISFQTACHQMRKDAQSQFEGVREDYQLPHPVGLVLTYATLSKYYHDVTADKVLQMWKQAVEDWQTLGDGTRNLHEYKRWEQFYGRDEKTFDKEKNRKFLMESYLHRENNMRVLARRTGKKPADVFDASAFELITFQEAASNDILLNTMFLANPKSLINEDSGKREQFEREKNIKYIDFPAKKQRSQDEAPDETDLYLAKVEAQRAKNGYKDDRKNPAEQGPGKALAHSSAMLVTRALQQTAKTALKNLRPV